MRFADIWKVRIGVLVARGGVSEEWFTFAGKAAPVLEFGGGIDISMTISVERLVENQVSRCGVDVRSWDRDVMADPDWFSRCRRASKVDAAEERVDRTEGSVRSEVSG